MSDEFQIFRDRVKSLSDEVAQWTAPNDWITKEYPKKMRDDGREIQEIPALFLQRGPIRLLLDPIAYDVPGAEGLVDLYLMPTYDDIASLYFENGGWVIHYAFPPDPAVTHSEIETEALPLTESNINRILEVIASHAEP